MSTPISPTGFTGSRTLEPSYREEASDVEEPSRLNTDASDSSKSQIVADTAPDVGSSTEQAEASSPATAQEESEGQLRDEQKTEEEEENPFGDILQSSEKEKKRYSSHPIEQESSTTTSNQ